MDRIAVFMDTALRNMKNEKVLRHLRSDVQDFASQFPIPGI